MRRELSLIPLTFVTDGFVIFDHKPTPRVHVDKPPVLFVPEGFEPEEYLAPKRRHCGDRARYLLHAIHTQLIFNHRGRKEGVRLKADYLRKFMTKKNYVGITRDLEEGGVVEVTRKARDGQSYAYRLTEHFRQTTFRRCYPTDRRLIKSLRTWRANERATLTCPTRKHLRDQLSRVRIDVEAASRHLATLSLPPESYSDCLSCLLRLDEQEWYFTQDQFGRVHHNVTCLKRELRQFLRVDGEELVELDISNSQPLFCGLTYFIWAKNNHTFADLHSSDAFSGALSLKEENLELLLSLRSSIQEKQERGKGREQGTYPLPCPLDGNVNRNALNYLLLCEAGQLYEYLAEKAGVDLSDNARRSSFKQKVFSHVLFAKKKHINNPLAKVFQEEFPSIFEFVMASKHKDRSQLAGWMQRVESDFVIDRVVAEFVKNRSDSFVLTIHDSVLTKPHDADYVRELFQSHFGRFRVHPTLNQK